MKLFLDDERHAPVDWVKAYTAAEAIAILESGEVTHLSLDHDLGPETAGTGYDVCVWMERQVYIHNDISCVPAYILIHSANPVGRTNMERTIAAIRRRIEQLNGK